MIDYITEAGNQEDIVKILHPYVREWFLSQFAELSMPQLYAIPHIHKRGNILVSAPTGSGKTLTAFLSILNELVILAEGGNLMDQIYAVYISPLKALNNDIQFNLERPLEGIKQIAARYGKELNIRVGVRTGDTTAYEKSKMLIKPPHILITTPESLAIVLSSTKFRHLLSQVWWTIVDEIHSLAENKRGIHLMLSLERMQRLSEFTRIGLSATVAPLDEIAQFLVGDGRNCSVVDVQFMKNVDIKVTCPVDNLITASFETRQDKMYKLIQNLIEQNRTTLIFTNTRAGTERVVHHLKEKYPSFYTVKNSDGTTRDLIGAHHGSLGKELRLEIEDALRAGAMKCVVTSTSLELGIDIGYVDLVILLGSPKSVARALQRVGRAGHKVHATAVGRFVVMDRDELLECSLILKNALERKIDQIHIPQNCLDVLAQQLFGMCITDVMDVEELYATVKKAYSYRNLDRVDFNQVMSYLAGDYAALEDRNVYAKIWVKEGKAGRRSAMSRVMYMTNIGTIPDQTAIKVKCGERIVGTVDEQFAEKLRKGDIFVLGGSTYHYNSSKGTVLSVTAAPGKRPTVPNWVSEMLPLSFDLSQSIQDFRFLMEDHFESSMSKNDILEFIKSYLYVDDNAALSLYEYFREQYYYAVIPHKKRILVEEYQAENETYYVFHTLFGRRVNEVLSRSVAYAINQQQKRTVLISVTDHGFVLTSEKQIYPLKALGLLKSDELDQVMKLALDNSQVLSRRFRHCAGRSLMILREYKGRKKSVGKQQVSSMLLMAAIKRISDDFPILKEARREVLEDLMDIENAKKVLRWIEDGTIVVRDIKTNIPSPFAFNLVMHGYSDVLSMEDRVEFVKRMHQQVLAKIGLKKGNLVAELVPKEAVTSIN